jgi:hypothetical protein
VTRAVSVLIAASRRELSLVDAVSFEAMRQRRIDRAFAFDRHFEEAGFSLVLACRTARASGEPRPLTLSAREPAHRPAGRR